MPKPTPTAHPTVPGHTWRPILRRCTCGWSQSKSLGWRRAGFNFPHHLADVASRPSPMRARIVVIGDDGAGGAR